MLFVMTIKMQWPCSYFLHHICAKPVLVSVYISPTLKPFQTPINYQEIDRWLVTNMSEQFEFEAYKGGCTESRTGHLIYVTRWIGKNGEMGSKDSNRDTTSQDYQRFCHGKSWHELGNFCAHFSSIPSPAWLHLRFFSSSFHFLGHVRKNHSFFISK